MNTFLFTLREGLRNVRRAPLMSLTSVAVMGLTLFVLGIFLLITVNLRNAISAVQKQVEVVVFVNEDILDGELQALDTFLREHPAVQDVRFLTRDDALADFRRELKDREYLLEAMETNPLPDTFEVALFDDWKTTDRIDEVAGLIQGMAGVDEVKYGKEWVGRLNHVIFLVVACDLVLGVIVALSSLVVVSNTVKLTLIARKDMIDLLKMVGATAGVIRRPFVIEGVVKGLLASLMAAALLTFLTMGLQERVPEVVSLSVPLLMAYLLFGATLGGLGSVFSLQGFLRRW
ncbi:MAG TPA: permease-like cell division protein FtsX [bacterium]|nr:permease-like cell division protein FtsX [bacterium]